MKIINRKGFTILELVIVIAVVAILAAIVVPNFTDVVSEAQKSNDLQLIKNIHSVLEVERGTEGGVLDLDTAKKILKENGIGRIKVKYKNNAIYWDAEKGYFILYTYDNGGMVLYPFEYAGQQETENWTIVDGDIDPQAEFTITVNCPSDVNYACAISGTIQSNQRYTARFSVPATRALTGVRVMMGSSDITNSVITEQGGTKIITVEHVTDDLVIDIAAPVNQVAISTYYDGTTIYGSGASAEGIEYTGKGYLDDRYISDGTKDCLFKNQPQANYNIWTYAGYVDKCGYVSTGWMKLPNTSTKEIYLYIKNGELKKDDKARFYFYDSLKSKYDIYGSFNDDLNKISTFSCEVVAINGSSTKNSMKITVTDESIKYFRASVMGLGENLFISFNEPIFLDGGKSYDPFAAPSQGETPETPEEVAAEIVFTQQSDIVTEYLANANYNGTYTTSIFDNTGYYLRKSISPKGYTFSGLDASIVKIVVKDENGVLFYEDTVEGGTYTVYNLIPNKQYTCEFFDSSDKRVKFKIEDKEYDLAKLTSIGPVRQIYTKNVPIKYDNIEGAQNFRDLGGWTTSSGGTIKYGLIYRSAMMDTFTDYDKWFFTSVLNIKDVFDLRSDTDTSGTNPDEAKKGYFDGYGVTQHGLSGSANQYVDLIEQPARNKPIFETIFNCVMNDKPVLFHCVSGADRTGTVAFMIEALLGVSENDLARDYELTHVCGYKGVTYVSIGVGKDDIPDHFINFITAFKALRGETFEEKAFNWFLDAGFTVEQLNAFRAKMIENETVAPFVNVTYVHSGTKANKSNAIILGKYNYETTIEVVDTERGGDIVVTVTIGGVDVTSQVTVNGGNVTIPASIITGDIVISARTNAAPIVTTDLSNVTISSNAITDNKFEASLTVTSGQLTYVRVKHGTEDITASAYNPTTKQITVTNVTGDIEVTAYAVTNLVPTSISYKNTTVYNGGLGYANEKYISTSSTVTDNNNIPLLVSDTANSEYVATGFIKLNWTDQEDVLYIYVNDGTIAGDKTRFYMYDTYTSSSVEADFKYDSISSFISNNATVKIGNENSEYVGFVFSKENTYIRMSVKGAGENLIVSFNEPIFPADRTGGYTYPVYDNTTVEVTKVELNKTTTSLTVGGSETLTATVTPDNATDATVTWTSSDNSVVAVVDGKITALSTGTATITATVGDLSATCTVTVSSSEGKVNALKTAINVDGTPYNNGLGYKTGYRLNSSGVESKQDGIEVTGFINITGKTTVTLNNIHLEAGSEAKHAYCYITYYSADFSLMYSNYAVVWINNYKNNLGEYEYVSVSDEEKNLVKFQIIGTEDRPFDKVVYMRISAVDINSESAIYLD